MSELKAYFLNVGQGDCTLIELPDGRFMLVDIFRCPGNGIDVFKFLDAILPDGENGKKKLDFLVVTHAHSDHITGIGDLYDRYEIEWIWAPRYETRPTKEGVWDTYVAVIDKHPDDKIKRPQGSRTPLNESDDADYDLGDGITLRVFSPPGYVDMEENLPEDEARKAVHAECLVLLLDYQGGRILLTGDSDLVCWQRIEGYYPDEVEADVFAAHVLHASHHGSRTFVKKSKDDEPWLQALKAIDPTYVVISVGDNNKFDHPDDDMLAIYQDQVGADKVLQTDTAETLIATVDESGEVSLEPAPGEYATDYAWDDDEGDEGGEDGSKSGGGPGGGGAAARRRSQSRLDNSAAA